MKLKIEAQRLREQKRRELEARFPALRKKQAPASPTPPVPSFLPPAVREKRIVIGRDRNGLVFALSDESRFRHTTIIGCPGSGKSNSIVHGIKQDLLNGAAVVVADPHGNHPDSVYQKIVRWLWTSGVTGRRKVHLVDPGSGFSAGFNPLARPNDTDATVIAGHMVEAVERGWGDEDSQEKPTMRRALRAPLHSTVRVAAHTP